MQRGKASLFHDTAGPIVGVGEEEREWLLPMGNDLVLLDILTIVVGDGLGFLRAEWDVLGDQE